MRISRGRRIGLPSDSGGKVDREKELIMSGPDDVAKFDTLRAAAYTGISPRTLEKLRQKGGGPVFLKLGRSVVYVKADLDDWLSSCRRLSTSDPGELRQGSR